MGRELNVLRKRISGIEKQKRIAAYVLVLPTLVLFLVFRIFPVFYSFYLSLSNWKLLNPNRDFVGMGNYIKLITDPGFWNSLKITMFFALLTVPILTGLGLGVALLFNTNKVRFPSFCKAVWFAPVVTMTVAAAIVWEWLYEPQFGIINYIFSLVGLSKQSWLLDKNLALFSIAIMNIWQQVGFSMIILLAGLQSIPEVYYEAAKIDGVNRFHCLKDITLPLLKPTMLFIVIITTIRGLQVFDQVYVMTAGGPINRTKVAVLYIYETGFTFQKAGYASAMAMVLFGIILIITLLQLKVTRQWQL